MSKELNNYVLGIVWNEDIKLEQLEEALKEINEEYPLDKNELCIYSVDRESAVKYGLWDSLARTSLIATASRSVINFYIEFDDNREKLLMQLAEYVKDHNGDLVMINPEGDEALMKIRAHITESNCLNLSVVEV